MIRPDEKLTPELRAKFLRFRAVYEATRIRLTEEGASGAIIATSTWQSALRTVLLTPDELRLYKTLVALHSVNGGELFA